MAGRPSRSRRDPVARFNTFEVPENEIKAQLLTAQRAQRALRARSFFLPKPARSFDEDNDLPLSPSDDKSLIGFPTGLDQTAGEHDGDRPELDRTFSFNSLSTLQRQEEAARLSQYRDSPVSACMTDRVPLDTQTSVQDPCPPLTVYTLKQARKDEKDRKKSVRKDKLHQSKSKRSGSEGSATHKDQDEETPRRAASDPSYRRPKELAFQLLRRLKSNKPLKLVHRPQSSPADVPHIDDFDNKASLRGYLNASLPETVTVEPPPGNIAELPGSLPPAYTPYSRTATRSDTASRQPMVEHIMTAPMPRSSSFHIVGGCESRPPKMMRCDSCQFGIKHEDRYLRCQTCGDRIICEACDATGFSCRHQLIRENRKVLQLVDGTERRQASRSPSRARREQSRRSTVDSSRTLHYDGSQNIEPEPMSGISRTSDVHKKALEYKELELQRREQALLHREREATLQQREGMLRIREAEVEAKARQSETNNNADFMRSCMEMAANLGAQFASMSRSSSNASAAPPSPTVPPSVRSADPYFPGSVTHEPFASFRPDDYHIRSHGPSKRKAAGSADPGRPTLNSSQNANRTPFNNWEDGNGDDGEELPGGTPKKFKQDGEAAAGGGRLYACHYCKFDPSRYSDRNTQEKCYRGCSGGFWPDISRLKQHLYRNHWRGKHCRQCFAIFKSDNELEEHRQSLVCEPKRCPFPEKFDTDVHTEIRKKRPQQNSEQVWYTLWDILFPGTPRPETPYADRSTEQAISSPSLTAEPQRVALERLFEARLSQNSQTWMTPEMRSYMLDQLRESMAELATSTQTDHSSLQRSSAPHRSSAAPSRPRLTIPDQPSISSSATSSQPVSALSATSAHSMSSERWHRLSSHRRSFSRLLPSRRSQSSIHIHDDRFGTDSALTSAVETTPSEHIFNVRTPADPENDNWDSSSHSWQQGDELGLAVTTNDGFAFPFNVDSKPPAQVPVGQAAGNVSSLSFQPVKLQSLTEPESGSTVPTQLTAKLPSVASVDSGYGSMHTRNRFAPSTAGMPVAANGGWVPYPSAPALGENHNGVPAQSAHPVPDSQIDWGALDMSFTEFTDGGAWDGSHDY